MYKIEQKDYGIKLTFEGFIQRDEMREWVRESERVLAKVGNEFHVFVDMRNLKPIPEDSQAEMEKGQKMYKRKGMVRSVVILANSILTLQFKRIAKKTGIYEWERYVDASSIFDWEQVGERWIIGGIDPDQKKFELSMN